MHGVTGKDTRENFVTELRARDVQGRQRWHALVLLISPGSLSSL